MTGQHMRHENDLIERAIDDDDEPVAFGAVFDDDDLPILQHNASFQSAMDEFVRSRDFSMEETGVGDDDAFGHFEPTSSSMVGSIDNNESFAGCNSAPDSPPGCDNTRGSTSAFETGHLKPPITEVYVDFSGMTSHASTSLDSSVMYSSEDQDVLFSPGAVDNEQQRESPRRMTSNSFSNDPIPVVYKNGPSKYSPRNHTYSNQNQFIAQEKKGTDEGEVDDMFQQFTLEQLEPEPLIQPIPLQPNGMQQHFMQNSYGNPTHVPQHHILMQQKMQQQQHPQMLNGAMQPQPFMQNIHQQQHYHPSAQPFSTPQHPPVGVNPTPFQPHTQTTMMMDNSSHSGQFTANNNFQMGRNNSSHGSGTNFQANQQIMMNHSSHGVPIPPNSQRMMSRNSFHSHQPLTSQTHHGAPFQQHDGMMVNSSSLHVPSSSSAALNGSFHHEQYQRRTSTPFKDISAVGTSGMQGNVAIPQERNLPQKFTIGGGYESPGANHTKTGMQPTNMNDVMENLSVSMRRSAMSRSMVKHISGRSVVSQNSSRGLLASQSSSRGVGPNQGMMMSHHSNRGSERNAGIDGRPVLIHRLSTNVKHQPPGQSVHRNNSHRSLNQSNHGQITLQIDDRNVGTF